MSFLKSLLFISLILLSACADVLDDINPSGSDKRGDFDSSTIGSHPGETAADFSVFDTLNNTFVMSSELVGADAIVVYFTMWCPICDSHMTHMRANIIPDYPNVKFYFIDYVSGLVSVARASQLDNGYGSSTVLVDDSNHTVTDLYDATMGTTIVIDRNTIVQMNEDYKDGSKLKDILDALP